jgi:hypothetical protein
LFLASNGWRIDMATRANAKLRAAAAALLIATGLAVCTGARPARADNDDWQWRRQEQAAEWRREQALREQERAREAERARIERERVEREREHAWRERELRTEPRPDWR